MQKTIKFLVQNSTGEVTQALDVMQGRGDKGQTIRFAAVRGARYKLEDPTAGNTGPDSVRTKRVGKNLNVMLEGSTEPDLVLENYYDTDVAVEGAGGLYGQAEDGNVYEYIPEDPNAANLAVALADGGLPVSQVLGGGAVASTFQLAALPLLAVGGGSVLGGGGLLAAAAGVLGAATLANAAKGAAASGLGLAPDLLATSDTGPSSIDNITSVVKPSFSVGPVPAGSSAQLLVDGVLVSTSSSVDAQGNTILTPATALSEGKHTVVFNYKDSAGVTSANSVALEVTVDVTAPSAPTSAPTLAEASDGSLSAADIADGTVVGVPLAGTKAVAGDTVTVMFNDTPTTYVLTAADITAGVANVTVTKATLDSLAQGVVKVTTYVSDVAGNKGSAGPSLSLTLDSTAPTAPGLPVVAENADGGINAAEMADGSVALVSIAATGAVAGDVLSVTVDGGQPANYTLLATDITAGVAKVTLPKALLDAAGQGTATVVATLIDAVGNKSGLSAKASINIDTLAPTAPSAPTVAEADGGLNAAEAADGTVADVSLAGTGAVAGDKVTVTVDGVATSYVLLAADITAGVAHVTIPKSVLDAAGQGAATVTATVTDAVGNVSALSPATTIQLSTTNLPTPPKPAASDNVGQTQGAIAEGDVSDDTTPTLSGTATAGNAIQVLDNGVLIGTVTVPSGGKWEFTPDATKPLAPGAHALTVQEVDSSGNKSAASPALNLVVNTTTPTVTLVVTDDVGAVQGTVADGGSSNDVLPTLSGKATPNSVVTLKDGATLLTTVIANAAGDWTYTLTASQTQADGTHTYTASVSIAGNTATATQKVVVDTAAPTAPGSAPALSEAAGGLNAVEAADGTVADVSLSGTGAVAGDTVTVTVDGVPTAYVLKAADITAGVAHVTIPKSVLDAAGQGSATVSATVTDAAGNTSPASAASTINIDTAAPLAPASAPTLSEAAGGLNAAEAADGTVVEVPLTGTGAVAGDTVTVTIDGVPTPYVLQAADITAGKANVTIPKSVLDAAGQGPASVSATVTDAAGNTSPASAATTINIDTLVPTAPAAPVVAEAAGGLNAAEAADGTVVDVTLTGTGAAAGDTLTVNVDGVPTTYVLQPSDIASGLAHVTIPKTVLDAAGQGPASVSASLLDAAGNASPVSAPATMQIDTVAPTAPAAPTIAEAGGGGINATEAADGTVADVSLTGTGAVAGDTVTVTVDGVATPYVLQAADIVAGVAHVTIPKSVLDAAGEGAANVSATVTDAAGNMSPVSAVTTINIDRMSGGVNANVIFTGLTIDIPNLSVGDSKDSGASNTDFVTNDHTLSVRGSVANFSNLGASANDKVWVQILAPDGVTVAAEGAVSPDLSGNYTFNNQGTPLADGKYTLKTLVIDGVGNVVKMGDNQVLLIDSSGAYNYTTDKTDNNASAAIGGLTIHDPAKTSMDSGASNTDFITSDNTLVIEGNVTGFSSAAGTGGEGDRVWVQIMAADGVTVTAQQYVTPAADGSFSFDNTANALADGKYMVKTTIVDSAGNVVKTGPSQALVIDTNGDGFDPSSNPGNTPGIDPNAGPAVSFSNLSINDTGASSTDFITAAHAVKIDGHISGFSAVNGGAGDRVWVQILAADGVTVVAQTYVLPDVFNGNYSFDNRSQSLADGVYTIKTSVVDAAGNIVKPGDSQRMVIDTNKDNTDAASNPANTPVVDGNTAVSFSAFTIIDAAKNSQDTGASDTDFVTRDATLVFKGTAAGFQSTGGSLGDRVRVQVVASDGVTVVAEQYVVPQGNGNFVFDNTGNTLGDGNYTLKIAVVDAAGNVVKAGANQALVIDTSATINPANANAVDTNTSATFTNLTIHDVAKGSLDDGASSTDFITSDTTLVIEGKVNGFTSVAATAGDRVLVQIVNSSGTVVAQQFVTPDASGNYSFDNRSQVLAEGTYSLKTSVVDTAGNTVATGDSQALVINGSAASALSITGITSDTGPSATDFVTNDNTLSISGHVTSYVNGSGNQVRVTVYAANGTTVVAEMFVTPNAAGDWTFDNTANTLSDGSYTLSAVLVNAAHTALGAPVSQALVVDTSDPIDTTLALTHLTLNVPSSNSTDTGVLSDDFITSDNTLAIAGQVTGFTPAHDTAGDRVWVRILKASDNSVVASHFASVKADGSYVFDNTQQTLADGNYLIKTSVMSSAGNVIKEGDSQALVIDTGAPVAPTSTSFKVMDDVGLVQGQITTTTPVTGTDDTLPEITGTAAADVVRVNIYDGTLKIGSATPVGGTWSFTPDAALTSGQHAWTVTFVDAAQNESSKSAAVVFNVVGATPTAPAITGVSDNQGDIQGAIGQLPSGNNSTTDDTTPTFSGTGTAGTQVRFFDLVGGVTKDLGSTNVAADGSWSFTPTALAQGQHSITAQTVDAVGQVSPETGAFVFNVDTLAPTTPSVPTADDNVGQTQGAIAANSVTDDATPTFSGTGTKGDTIKVFDGTTLLGSTVVTDAGTWSFTPTTALAAGAHAITTTATDAAGNQSLLSSALNFTVNTDSVAVTITKVTDNVGTVTGDVSNAGATDDTTPTLVGTATPNAVVTLKEGTTVLGTATADSLGAWSFTPSTAQSAGTHNYTASVTLAGNTSTASYSVTIDTTAPAVPSAFTVGDDVGTKQGNLVSGAPSDDTTPTLSGTGTKGDLIKVYDGVTKIGEVLVKADGTWNITLPVLSEATHSLTVTATDPVGNESAHSTAFTVVVDATPPVATLSIDALTGDGLINATEAAGMVSITGKATGEFTTGDTVKLMVNGKTSTGTLKADGTFSIDVNGSDLTANTSHKVSASLDAHDEAGNTATVTANQTYTVGTAPVAKPDVATAQEAGGVSNATAGVNPSANVLTNDTDVDVGDTKMVQDIQLGTGTVTAVTAAGTSVVGLYGALLIKADGSYTYTVDNTNATVEALNTNSTPLSETFTYTVKDSFGLTSHSTLTVNVNGANDAAVIGGQTGGTLMESSTAQTLTGKLTITDVDSSQTFVAKTTAGTYGTLTVATDGQWTYTMSSAHNGLAPGEVVFDQLTVTASDGTTQKINIEINGTNDAPVPILAFVDSHVMAGITVPTVSIADNNVARVANNGVVTFTLTFSEAVDAATFTAADVVFTNATMVANSFTKVDATHWTVQAQAPSTGSGIAAISIADAAYSSSKGVAGLGAASTQTFGVDNGLSGDASGTAFDDVLIGGDGNDTIIAEGGADKIYAGAGNDTLVLNADNLAQMEVAGNGMFVDGGTGTNTLRLDAAGQILNLTDPNVAVKLHNISTIDLGQASFIEVDGHQVALGNTQMVLSIDNVRALTAQADQPDLLVVNGVLGDGVYLVNSTSWTQGTTPETGASLAALYPDHNFVLVDSYYRYTLDGVTLFVNTLMGEPSSPDPAAVPVEPFSGAMTEAVTVDSLFAATFSDAESGSVVTPQSFKGVAVTQAGTAASMQTLGKFQYLDANSMWTDLPADLSDTNAVYLAHDAKIRFIAATGNAALVKPDLQVRLIDTSALSGTALLTTGDTVDASANGVSEAFSGHTVTLTDHVTAHISDNAASVVANGGVVTYTVALSRDVDVNTLTADDITVVHLASTGTMSAGTVSNFTYDTALHHWTFTVTEPASGSGTTLISLADGSYATLSGATGMGATLAQTYGTKGATDLTGHTVTLAATAADVTIDATDATTFEAMQGVGTVDVTGGGNNTVTLDLQAVMHLPSAIDNPATTAINESHMMVVNGNGTGLQGASDTLKLMDGAHWSTTATHLTAANLTPAYATDFVFTAGHTYSQYTNGMATLFVDEQMFVSKMM